MSLTRYWNKTVVLQKLPNRRPHLLAVAGVLVCVWLGVTRSAAGQCQPPRYHRGYSWEDSPSTIMMNISIPLSDFAPTRLVCLSDALRKRYADRKRILVSIFSSSSAAEQYKRPFIGDSIKPRVNWELQMHAVYSFDATKGEEYVEIMPYFGLGPEFYTRIHLPSTVIPHCTLEIESRCLLALDKIEYPWAALKTKVSGTVTLTAKIDHNGQVGEIKASDEHIEPGAGRETLVNEAIANLRTWRFEPAPRRDAVRISFAYMLDPSLAPHGAVQIHFELPKQVIIKGNPPE